MLQKYQPVATRGPSPSYTPEVNSSVDPTDNKPEELEKAVTEEIQ